jgi:uncharacterized iron-regulated protein
MLAPLALALLSQQSAPLPPDAPDSYLLKIGRPGQVVVGMGYTDSVTGKKTSADAIAQSCKDVQFLLVGESHATPSHHQAQADLIRALIKSGRTVTVGMEMFTRDHQLAINGLSTGAQSIEEFELASDWKTQWGHSYAAYRPVLEAIRDNKLRIVALNVPRPWVSQASKQGYESFDEMQRKWVPMLDLTNKNHEAVVSSLMGGHPLVMGSSNMLAGQVTWDTGMAKTALDWRTSWPYKKNIMVILAGAGHVMYGQGINYRLNQLEGQKSKSVICVHDLPNRPVSRGLGDFFFVGELPAEK